MRRPTKQDGPTSEVIDAVARPLFYARGIRNIGLDDIAAAASITKRTLYYHFATKDDLVVACLESWQAQSKARLTSLDELPGDARIDSVFKALAGDSQRTGFKGRPFVNALVELSDPHHPSAAVTMAFKAERRDWFARALKDIGHANPHDGAEQLMVLFEGALVRSQFDDTGLPARLAGDMARLVCAQRAAQSKRKGS
jgi:AcrR family transcriptional regulator